MSFRAGENLPILSDDLTVGRVLHEASTISSSFKRSIKRRSGAVVLVDGSGKISGIFTDGDLRRLITDDPDSALKKAIREVMTPNPRRIDGDHLAAEAMSIMRPLRIDDLPVVDAGDKPIGLIDIQDLVTLKMLETE
jgi:arabinose-5-phosphate isomerase